MDKQSFHELIVAADGSLAINAYAGEPVRIDTPLEALPEQVIRRLLAACTGRPATPNGR